MIKRKHPLNMNDYPKLRKGTLPNLIWVNIVNLCNLRIEHSFKNNKHISVFKEKHIIKWWVSGYSVVVGSFTPL